MTVVLECERLSRRFADVVALDQVSLQVHRGEVVALAGLNGAGKTTLMRLVLGMVRPTSGAARILGQDVRTAPDDVWARVGQMIETPFAYPELTVRENLWAAARLHGVPRAQARTAAERIIGRLGLDEYADRRCGVLSLGNRQRVGLASALLHSPGLVVLDEPTNALDPAGVVLLRDLIRELAAAGAAVVVSSHHLDEVARVADRVEVIHRGTLLGELATDRPDLERAFFDTLYRADVRAGLAPETVEVAR